MVDFTKIAECLKGVVSWKNTLATDEQALDGRFSDPSSGLYYNLNSEVINLTKVSSIAPIPKTFNYPEYSDTEAYDTGDIVQFVDLYQANEPVTGEQPDTSAKWEKLEPFSDWLEDFTKTVCYKLSEAIVTKKKIDRQSKSLLSDRPLYSNVANFRDSATYVPNNGRFVGLKISAKEMRDVDVKIKKLILQFTEVQTDLPIYVFHSSQLEPVYTFTVSTTKAKSANVVSVPAVDLLYNSEEYTRGGCFYLGYYQEDVNGLAIKDQKFKFEAPCASCNSGAFKNYQEYSKFISVSSVSVPSTSFVKGEMWDVRDELEECNTFGINIYASAECSLNGYICENRDLFANALITQAEVLFSESVINTDRTNELDRRMLDQAAFNLSPDGFNLKAKLEEQIDAINFDLSDLDSPCAPKMKKRIWRGSV